MQDLSIRNYKTNKNQFGVGKTLIFSVLIITFVFNLLGELVPKLNNIKFLNDVLNVCILIYALFFYKKKISNLTICLSFLFMLYLATHFIFGLDNMLTTIRGVRNTFRVFLYLINCSLLLKKEDYSIFYKFVYCILFFSTILSLYQYFALDLSGDYIGGVFGTNKGCNSYLNIFLIISTTLSIYEFYFNKISFLKFIFILTICLLNAGLSELKIYFFEFIIIGASPLFFKVKNKKYYKALLAMLVILLIGVFLLYWLYPNWRGFFNIKSIIESITNDGGYTNAGDINRFNFINKLGNSIADFNIFHYLFGFGIGSFEYSTSFTFLQSKNYLSYSNLHYQRFASSFTFVEQGLFGVSIIILFFLNSLFISHKKIRQSHDNQCIMHLKISQVIAFLGLILFFYNDSIRSESFYIVMFVISYIYVKGEKKYAIKSI